jgi:hypothetical protein
VGEWMRGWPRRCGVARRGLAGRPLNRWTVDPYGLRRSGRRATYRSIRIFPRISPGGPTFSGRAAARSSKLSPLTPQFDTVGTRAALAAPDA